MKSRWLKVGKILKRGKADALLVINSEESGQPATKYLSGFSGSSSVLLITKKKAFLITDSRYTGRAEEEAREFEVIILKPKETFSSVLKKLAGKYRLKKILIDGDETYFSSIEAIKKAVPEIEIVSKNRTLQELRTVKDKQEIALLKKAADTACKAFLKLLPEIKTGVSEKFLAERLDALCKEEGAEKMAFDTIVASGVNTALPHSTPSDKKLKNGELVMIDWGVSYRGYVSDMTRTLAIGKLSTRLRKIYEAVLEAELLGCLKARAGMTGMELDTVCRDHLTKKGFGKYFTHATGHGIGMEIHELPVIAPKQSAPLPTGAVITCEPGIYIEGVGGVRIEDSLLITKTGAINLTNQIPKELLVL